MARWLLDCEPLCGHRWRLGLATHPDERDAAFRLRHEVFFREQGFGNPNTPAADGRDTDSFDEWCDHLILCDADDMRMIGTYRAIPGVQALRRGGFYASAEFDLSPLEPIAHQILQGSRICVAESHRGGPAFQYLSYGMELLLRQYNARYFLGADSFRVDNFDALNRIYSWVRHTWMDPDWFVAPWPANRVEGLRDVPFTNADERLLPGVIRMDLHLGFRVCSPPAWDPDFRCYDFLVVARRDRMSPLYHKLVNRIERCKRT